MVFPVNDIQKLFLSRNKSQNLRFLRQAQGMSQVCQEPTPKKCELLEQATSNENFLCYINLFVYDFC